jgi:hypothetical protein
LKLTQVKEERIVSRSEKFHSVFCRRYWSAPYLEIATLPEADVLIVLDVPVVPGAYGPRSTSYLLFHCLYYKSSTLSPVLSMLISIITFSLKAAAAAFGLNP